MPSKQAGVHKKSCTTVRVAKQFQLSNVFTPGKDGFNDVFKIPAYGFEYFKVEISNRYGVIVFTSSDPNHAWNERVNNTGALLPSGMYFYQISIKESCKQELRKIKGGVYLIAE